MIQGWNNEFILNHDGRYVMSDSMLYGVIPVAAAYLAHTSNPLCEYNPTHSSCTVWGQYFHARWHMFRSDGLLIASKDYVGSSPVGVWKSKDNVVFTLSSHNS